MALEFNGKGARESPTCPGVAPQVRSDIAHDAWAELPQMRQPGDRDMSPVRQSLGRRVGKGRRQRQRDKDPDLQERL